MAGVTLLAMVVCQLPAPLPAPAAATGKDRSELYPCRDRACGCGSAAACWTGCCCFTNAQKVAWAKANGVAIPAFVHEAARKEQAESAAAPSGSSCCGTKPAAKPSCCGSTADACDAAAENDGPADNAAEGEDAPPMPLGWMAQKCRGEIAACGALPWALRPTLFEALALPLTRWDGPTLAGAEAAGTEPPTPPPRRGPAVHLF